MLPWLRFAYNVWRSAHERLDFPYKLTFVTTKECHSRCTHCSIWKVRPSGELTLEEITRIAHGARKLSWIDFTGGEPTDREDLVEIVAAFLLHCPNLLLVHFPTNGLKPKRIASACARIAALRPARFVVTVSIDGPPAVNDAVRGIPGDFDRAVETFQTISSIKGVEAYIGMTLYRENFKMIDETFRAIKERLPRFSLRKLHLNIGHSSPHYYEQTNTLGDYAQELSAELRRYQQRRGFPRSPFDIIERLYQSNIRRYLETQRTPLACSALQGSCFLSEKGELFPCTIWSEPLGNVRDHEYSIAAILKKEKALTARKNICQGNCPHCWTPCEAYPSLLAHLSNPLHILPQ